MLEIDSSSECSGPAVFRFEEDCAGFLSIKNSGVLGVVESMAWVVILYRHLERKELLYSLGLSFLHQYVSLVANCGEKRAGQLKCSTNCF